MHGEVGLFRGGGQLDDVAERPGGLALPICAIWQGVYVSTQLVEGNQLIALADIVAPSLRDGKFRAEVAANLNKLPQRVARGHLKEGERRRRHEIVSSEVVKRTGGQLRAAGMHHDVVQAMLERLAGNKQVERPFL